MNAPRLAQERPFECPLVGRDVHIAPLPSINVPTNQRDVDIAPYERRLFF